MLLKHHIRYRKDRFTAVNTGDRLWIALVHQPEQRHRCIHWCEQCIVLSVEGNELLQKAEQILSITVPHEHGGNVTAAAGGGVAHEIGRH